MFRKICAVPWREIGNLKSCVKYVVYFLRAHITNVTFEESILSTKFTPTEMWSYISNTWEIVRLYSIKW